MRMFLMTMSVGLGTLCGIFSSDRLRSRCVILEDMLIICRAVRIKSVCQGIPIGQVLQSTELHTEAVRQMLAQYWKNTKTSTSAKAWESAIDVQFSGKEAICGITAQDAQLFSQLGQAMGRFLHEQQKTLEHLEQALHEQLKEAKQIHARRGSMQAKLGLLFGLIGALFIG